MITTIYLHLLKVLQLTYYLLVTMLHLSKKMLNHNLYKLIVLTYKNKYHYLLQPLGIPCLLALLGELNNSLMIGDSWENDIVGAAGVGMHQVFYNLSGRTDLPFAPTYQITDLKDLFNFL